jgi:hypothetical protein
VGYGYQPMSTFGLRNRRVPRSRLASCAEVACPAHVNGWRTVIAASDPQAAARIAYIRNDSGRRFTETPGPDGGSVYTFPAGQTCFSEHWTESQHPLCRARLARHGRRGTLAPPLRPGPLGG